MSKDEEQRESRFWWHGQNLKKEDSSKAWFHRRGWFHDRKTRRVFGVEFVMPTNSCHAYIELGGGGDHDILCSFACWLFAIYVHAEGLNRLSDWMYRKYSYHSRRIEVSIHFWALWWHIWVDSNEHHAKTPKWRDGCFHFDDFFLGKAKHRNEIVGKKAIEIALPEGTYPAILEFSRSTWKRPRWFAKRIDYTDIEVKDGVPIPGKGENSWDCDDDALFSLCSPGSDEQEAIQHFIERVQERRKRYGGKNWQPVR